MTHTSTDSAATIAAVTDETFADVVLASERPVLVDFWAPWCGPCTMLDPIVERIATERVETLTVVSMNTDETLTGSDYRVMGVPTLLLFRAGEPVLQLVGARPKSAIDAELDRVLG